MNDIEMTDRNRVVLSEAVQIEENKKAAQTLAQLLFQTLIETFAHAASFRMPLIWNGQYRTDEAHHSATVETTPLVQATSEQPEKKSSPRRQPSAFFKSSDKAIEKPESFLVNSIVLNTASLSVIKEACEGFANILMRILKAVADFIAEQTPPMIYDEKPCFNW